MHTLIIKGDEQAAFAACDARKLEITSIVYRAPFDECIVTVPEGLPTLDVLVQWFCAGNPVAPYADGTLLWYGPAKRSVWNGNLIVPDGTIAAVQDFAADDTDAYPGQNAWKREGQS